jgi:hypothetical protein
MVTLLLQGVDRLEAGSRHRVIQHRPAVAAPPLPRVLGQTLRLPRGGTPARKPADQGSRRMNGSVQSSLGHRDSVYGHVFRQRVKSMGVGEVLTAPHSPWQNLSFAKTPAGDHRVDLSAP